MKPHNKYTLEDWVAYWSPSSTNRVCQCHGDTQCAPCTVKELDSSWRRTLQVERASFHALNLRYGALKQRATHAPKRDAT